MSTAGPVFARPRTPAAKSLHLVRLNPIITRSELVEATGLSQPTITRATAALLKAGLIQERTDLTRSQGRGRPTVPLEASDNGWLLAGIAVGTSSTYIGLYDTRGRIIREDNVPTPVSKLSPDDFVEHVIAGVNRLATGVDRTLVSVGVTTSGTVDEEGKVHAANLGWDGMDIAGRLDFQFGVPVTVTPAVPAILASETQAAPLGDEARTLVLFADDSIGAALSDEDGVASIELPQFDGADPSEALVNAALAPRLAEAADASSVLAQRASDLGRLTAQLIDAHRPDTVVIAGSAFYDVPTAPKLFASAARGELDPDLASATELRMIPNHKEIVRSIARAVALDPLLRTPLELNTAKVRAA
ncbi:ROK family protein [Corynebacterium phoceense]|uniref:ROK family transcriptional regulator n=1 Tax=Corynebacterium phoceense TaxID=1686286 RepID=UPI00211CA346|nr:ROK family protein [Corynebacterium phoceense]MCQ9332003.1 ROK family protein [Corynebacterium phoceense]MCQ9348824.1 ROK family protein [Corynebacterium phoceense]